MFSMEEKNATVSHINVRDEKHGEETVLAVDIKFKVDMPNTVLDELHHGLRISMFGANEEQDDRFEGGHLPRLRYPMLDPIKMNLGEQPVSLTIHRVTHDIKVDGKVKKVVLECKEGGTVTAVFTVSCNPDPDVVGKLSGLLGGDHGVSLQVVKETDNS